MSKSNAFETALLQAIFNATALANLLDNAASSPATQLFVSLHVADPGEGGHQATSEAAWTGYARVGVNRNSGGWTVSGNAVSNAAAIAFAAKTGGSDQTITHFGVGRNSSGNGLLLYKGALGASQEIINGRAPVFQAGEIVITED